MLTIWGNKTQKLCDGIGRREFLRVGALGGALSLADLFRLQAASDPSKRPSRPKKSVIMVYLLGGPSQLDTYDMKPDAPAEYRGEFQPIRTRVSGIDICELFPRQAAMMDKLTIIRSLSATAPNGHSDAEVMTGRSQDESPRGQHPCMGSVISRVRGMSSHGVPPYVTMRKMSFPTATPLPTMLFYLQPGFLGRAHSPLSLSGSVENLGQGPAVADLQLPPGVDRNRLTQRRDLLAGFDEMRRDLDASGIASSLDAFQGQAFEIVTSSALRDALDVNKEPLHVRERYGPSANGYHGQGSQMLLARRLVEAGVGFVEVALGYWDTHGPANVLGFPKMREQLCPTLDQSLSALIEDLHQRGLDKDVVVIVWGEFGRSPRVNKDAGRDHWLPAMSAVIAGGGLKMGQVIGSTDARGENPKDRPYKISNVLATIYQAIGIDPAMTFRDGSGRPRYLLDEREPVQELL
jgi:hypothetical protein